MATNSTQRITIRPALNAHYCRYYHHCYLNDMCKNNSDFDEQLVLSAVQLVQQQRDSSATEQLLVRCLTTARTYEHLLAN